MKNTWNTNPRIHRHQIDQTGFVLLELLITTALIAMLVGVSFQGLSLIQESTAQFHNREVRNAIYSAGQRARNGFADSPWGVYLHYDEITREGTSLTLFSGINYLTRNQTWDLPLVLQGNVLFPNVSLSGAAPSSGNDHEIVFARFSGATSQYGTITIQTSYTSSIVSISSDGIVVQE